MGRERLMELYEVHRSVALRCGGQTGRLQSRGIEIVCAGGVAALLKRCLELVAVIPPSMPKPAQAQSACSGADRELTALLADMTLRNLSVEAGV